MKKTYLLFSAVLLSLLAGCSKDTLTELANISFFHAYTEDLELPEEATSGTSTSQPLGFSVPLPPFYYTFATGIDQIAADNNTSREKLISVKVDSLYVQASGTPNMDFIDKIQLSVTGLGLDTVLVGDKIPVPKGQTTVFLDTKNAELKPYFLKDSITLKIQASANSLPPLGTKVRFGNVYKVTANPLR